MTSSKQKHDQVLREIRQYRMATLICQPYTDTDDFVSCCTIGRDFKSCGEAEALYGFGQRIDLTEFLEGSGLPLNEMDRVFNTRGSKSPWLYSVFRKGGIQRFEQYLQAPLRIVEGDSNCYTPHEVIREIRPEQR